MAEIDVAVVIVTYKCAPLTIEALRSVDVERRRPGISLRVVIVDNASGDLPTIAEAAVRNGWLSWLTLVEAPRNGGFAFGNNLGIREVYATKTPDYVYLLNPDTQVRPGGIESLVRLLESRHEVGIAGSNIENLDGSDWSIAFRFPTILSELDSGLRLGLVSRMLRRWSVAKVMTTTPQRVDWVCGAAMMIRSSVLAVTGGLDENYFLYFEETDLCRRALLAGYSTWYVPDSRVMHIMGQSTGVTDPRQAPKPLPRYWFESRRRYYLVTYGLWRTVAIDLVAIAATSLGLVKQLALGRKGAARPRLIRDLTTHSALWPRNRTAAAFRSSIKS